MSTDAAPSSKAKTYSVSIVVNQRWLLYAGLHHATNISKKTHIQYCMRLYEHDFCKNGSLVYPYYWARGLLMSNVNNIH